MNVETRLLLLQYPARKIASCFFLLFIYLFSLFFMFVHVMSFCVWVWTQISSLETKMEMILRHQARIIHSHTVHS